MNLAPIALFVYNRLEFTKQTIETLQKNEFSKKSELIIYSDAAKNKENIQDVINVREFIKTINGFKKITVIERKENYGLANSIIDGVTNILKSNDKVIVLEDDLITSPYFLKFMNEALEFYRNEEKVWSITGWTYKLNIKKDYAFGSYLYPRGSSKSWATWSNRWAKVEFNEEKIIKRWGLEKIRKKTEFYGKDLFSMFLKQLNNKIDSWAIRYAINQIMEDKLTVYPTKSYVKDIGDACGTHANNSLSHKNILATNINTNFNNYIDSNIVFSYQKYLRKHFFKVKMNALKNKIKGLF